ncbi:Maf family nucleotide pyrophosphatase [Neoactinobaculum massilliense]|uniref:Maf family nucleotide pyrophosphatase n=1 Tax=Neoactinobaculum massilliense TaxID=2364794 RepID=UPI0019D24C6D|nr:Maf family nucleotide pyrophosphatase [Neoactinobaculum massilliense]
MKTLLLASQSAARLATLRAAGIDPAVCVSGFDEDAFLSSVKGGPAQKVLGLATGKAFAVAERLQRRRDERGDMSANQAAEFGADTEPDFVVGCDSMFEFDGEVYGKPHSAQVARERLRAMNGHSGVLHTGHLLIDMNSGRALGSVSHARVHFARMSAGEIDTYIATGEPLEVAGSFTTDGLGGSFIDRIDGDYHGVVGISLPLLRRMLAIFGVSITEFWSSPEATEDARPAGAPGFLAHRHDRAGSEHARGAIARAHGADAFYVDSEGACHWGLNGAAGVAAYRVLPGGTEILMQHRAAWSHGGDTWAVPGGAREWFETPLEGAMREFEEETQISRAGLDVRGDLRTRQGDWAYTTYVAEADAAAEPVADEESAELVWVPLEDVEKLHLLPSFAASWPELRAVIEGQ